MGGAKGGERSIGGTCPHALSLILGQGEGDVGGSLPRSIRGSPHALALAPQLPRRYYDSDNVSSSNHTHAKL